MSLVEELRKEFEDTTRAISAPGAKADAERYRKLLRRSKGLQAELALIEQCGKLEREIQELEEIVGHRGEDGELAALAERELVELRERRSRLGQELERLRSTKTDEEPRSVIMEIRAGAGGGEAALFAADLFRMYSRFAESQKWSLEVMDSRPTAIGGFKEVVFGVSGSGSYRRLRHEAGVHRVQRVPATEGSGRIHTSTVTVAVLPEPREVEVEIPVRDLRIETFRASGPGGQHVNVTDSAVRIKHIPTGITVQCQEERSQHKNKVKAMRVLRARLLERVRNEEEARRRLERRHQVGTGERSEKVRTYNFPQARVTDHRVGFTSHRLEDILKGDLGDLTEALERSLGKQEEK